MTAAGERGTRANQSPDVDPNLFARSSAGIGDDLDPGTVARNLRGLEYRMQYRVEAIEARDGKGAGAIQGKGVGIGYLLAKDLAEALGEAATLVERIKGVAQPSAVSAEPDARYWEFRQKVENLVFDPIRRGGRVEDEILSELERMSQRDAEALRAPDPAQGPDYKACFF